MTFRIVFQEKAELEALDAAAHISEKAGYEVGVRWLDGLMASVNGLSKLPRRCPIVEAVTEFPDAEV